MPALSTLPFVHPTREGATVKVCGNGMVDHKTYTGDMDVESLGINEHVRFAVLRDILEEAAGDQDTLRILIKARAEELIPSTSQLKIYSRP